MASENGLLAYEIKSGKLLKYGSKQGFSNEYLYAILPGKGAELWLSTNNGLICFDTQKQTSKNYFESDGLQSNEFNTGSYHRSPDGKLYFGGINGCSFFDPQHISPNLRKPTPMITGLEIVDKPVTMLYPLDKPLHMDLKHTENSFSVEFSGLDFINEENVTYRYRLQGIDKSWVHSGKRNFARYSGLEPGTYQFYCMAGNADGVWSRPSLLATISIHPPWWKKTWFVFFLGALALFILFKAIRELSTRKLRIQLRELEKREAVNKERNRIANDMHDDLGSGLTKISIMAQLMKSKQKNPEELLHYVDKISSTSGELVDNMGHIIWAMNADNDTLENFLAYIRQYSNQFFEDSHINFLFDLPDLNEQHYLNQRTRRNLFLVVKESMNNILKHAAAEQAVLSFQIEENVCTLVLTDNGNGFDIQHPRRYGNGLQNMKKRMQDIGGTYMIESEPGLFTRTTIRWQL